MIRPASSPEPTPSLRGFTLVEMLVAVALVLLIMSLFAQIFQTAASSISVQQGIAENDQQARMISGLIRGDLDKRTMRLVIPFEDGEDTRSPEAQLDLRQGYLSYSENNPADRTDDVLQFTAMVNLQQQARNATLFTGVANSDPLTTNLLGNAARIAISSFAVDTITLSTAPSASRLAAGDTIWVTGATDTNGNYVTNDGAYRVTNISGTDLTVIPSPPDINDTTGTVSVASEPDFDDGQPNNSLGSSSAAEIVYFLRAGNLYRRVLLIRDAESLDAAQPRFRNGDRVISSGTPATGDYPRNADTTTSTFWRDFDYSAFHFGGKTTTSSPPTIGSGLMFHSTGASLYNGTDGETVVLDDSDPTNVITFPVSLGMPYWRFGHDPESGIPREYLDLNGTPSDMRDDTNFIGRFLSQETASVNFGYPGRRPSPFATFAGGTLNPYARTLTATSGLAHVIDEFEDSPAVRRGDDIVMTNVLAFDIKIRDPQSGVTVDLGDTTDANNQSFRPGDRLNSYYAQDNRYRFDTWHPQAIIVNPTTGDPMDGTDSDPPFRPTDTATGDPLPITALQITIVYQSRTDGRIQQLTINQSLQDRPATN